MTSKEILEAMIRGANEDYLEIQEAEKDDDFNDALLSIERSNTSGRLDGLHMAYRAVYGENYELEDTE